MRRRDSWTVRGLIFVTRATRLTSWTLAVCDEGIQCQPTGWWAEWLTLRGAGPEPVKYPWSEIRRVVLVYRPWSLNPVVTIERASGRAGRYRIADRYNLDENRALLRKYVNVPYVETGFWLLSL
ncbi:MAG TPA: hypothetical protein VGF28_25200 [Thermoanaerobaculia bacterium]|jgi:hypothetical protein